MLVLACLGVRQSAFAALPHALYRGKIRTKTIHDIYVMRRGQAHAHVMRCVLASNHEWNIARCYVSIV